VIPILFKSSPQVSRQLGSIASNFANSEVGLDSLRALPTDRRSYCRGGRYVVGDSGGVGCMEGAEECLCPLKKPPSRPCLCPPPECPAPPKGVALVALLAFFSRSTIFFKNAFASFSSANDSPAKYCSVSNVWKNVRSWL
jgi:hypothetical protein